MMSFGQASMSLRGRGLTLDTSPAADPTARSGAHSRRTALLLISTVKPKKNIDVEVHCASWVNWDVDNQIPSNPERGFIGQIDLVRYKVLCWRLERQGIPVVADQICIG